VKYKYANEKMTSITKWLHDGFSYHYPIENLNSTKDDAYNEGSDPKNH